MNAPINKLQITGRMAKEATKKALKELTGPLAEQFEKLGVTFEDRYKIHIQDQMKIQRRAIELLPELDKLLDEYGLLPKKPEKLDAQYFWITLRPSDEHINRFKEFKHIVLTKYLTRNCFLSYRYAWEQKGENPDEIGRGYHIHILAHCPNYLMKTQLIKDSKSTFKKFLGGEVPDAFVQVEYVKTKEHFFNIRAYMMGYKSDTWKDEACATDIPWREREGLDPLYGSLDLENP